MKTTENQEGFILVVTMLILVILTLIGLGVVRTGKVEVEVAGSEKWIEKSFYEGDASTEVTSAVISAATSSATKLRDGKHKYGNVYLPIARVDMFELDKPNPTLTLEQKKEWWDTLWRSEWEKFKFGETLPSKSGDHPSVLTPIEKTEYNPNSEKWVASNVVDTQGDKIVGRPISVVLVDKNPKQRGTTKDPNSAWTNLSVGTGYNGGSSGRNVMYYNYWVKNHGDFNTESVLREQYRFAF